MNIYVKIMIKKCKKYIIKGKYVGIIFYNGLIKFIDNENNRYFGVELFN